MREIQVIQWAVCERMISTFSYFNTVSRLRWAVDVSWFYLRYLSHSSQHLAFPDFISNAPWMNQSGRYHWHGHVSSWAFGDMRCWTSQIPGWTVLKPFRGEFLCERVHSLQSQTPKYHRSRSKGETEKNSALTPCCILCCYNFAVRERERAGWASWWHSAAEVRYIPMTVLCRRKCNQTAPVLSFRQRERGEETGVRAPPPEASVYKPANQSEGPAHYSALQFASVKHFFCRVFGYLFSSCNRHSLNYWRAENRFQLISKHLHF